MHHLFSSPKALIVTPLLLILVIAAVIVAFLMLGSGGAVPQGEFLLDPGENVTFNIPLPEAAPTLIQATMQWQGTAGTLEVILLRPDGTLSKPVEVSPQAPSVSFRLDEAAVQQGLKGWRLNLRNNTKSGQADGTLSLTFTELR